MDAKKPHITDKTPQKKPKNLGLPTTRTVPKTQTEGEFRDPSTVNTKIRGPKVFLGLIFLSASRAFGREYFGL